VSGVGTNTAVEILRASSQWRWLHLQRLPCQEEIMSDDPEGQYADDVQSNDQDYAEDVASGTDPSDAADDAARSDDEALDAYHDNQDALGES